MPHVLIRRNQPLSLARLGYLKRLLTVRVLPLSYDPDYVEQEQRLEWLPISSFEGHNVL
jgi:hypothetical protein